MNVLALDCETLTFSKGHWADSRNKLVCYSYANDEYATAEQWSDKWSNLTLKNLIEDHDLIVGFNFKFDLHWLKKYNVDVNIPVWDCQIAEFILSHQTNRFPSLEETASKYGFPPKLDIVKTEYWDKGINTDEIPWEILREYARRDAELTLAIYLEQIATMTPEQIKLCKLQCMDLMILQEMEQNGIPFDEELCKERAAQLDDQISEIKRKLSSFCPSVPINWGSNDHVSAFLYGGVVKEESKEHIGFFKSGAKQGQPRYRNTVIEHALPRIYQPIKGSELQKDGYYATDESTLKKLKGRKDIIELLLTLAKLEKTNGTYYKGLPKLREERHWPIGKLHGNFNQTNVVSGRLSSNSPNLQNLQSDLLDIFVSEYND